MTLAEVLASVADQVSYLRATTSTGGADWRRCDELIANRATLVDVVEGTRAGFGADDVTVAASLFTQAYAFRVASVALGAYALGLAVPDVSPKVTAVRIDKPRPTAIAFLADDVHESDAALIAHELVGEHLAPFVDAVHDSFRVGQRLLLGNAAGSCAVVFRAIEGSGADRAAVRRRADAFMRECSQWFDGLGSFTVVEHAGQSGWFWNRTNCCLWYRTQADRLCDNCSLIPTPELSERRRRELAEITP